MPKDSIMTLRISDLALLALPFALLSAPASAQIYKCRNADGQVEISNKPCPSGANTIRALPEERVSEADRQRAEREVERMRSYVEKREAAQRAENAANAEREGQAAAPRPSITVTGNSGDRVEECLRELDRQALPPMQREQMEAACRNNGAPSPTYVPVPVPVYNSNSGTPLGTCIQNVERSNVSAAEKSRRVNECEARYAHPLAHPYTRPETKPAPPQPPANNIAVCPPNNRNCLK
ncbi:MAG: DUF4124 domain-containing protein [Rhodocyclales bacterium GT-UBC]|nr:MAG: DUF4124 domain-containing protein [Rhodocyclales bacterium GT-UBC]